MKNDAVKKLYKNVAIKKESKTDIEFNLPKTMELTSFDNNDTLNRNKVSEAPSPMIE